MWESAAAAPSSFVCGVVDPLWGFRMCLTWEPPHDGCLSCCCYRDPSLAWTCYDPFAHTPPPHPYLKPPSSSLHFWMPNTPSRTIPWVRHALSSFRALNPTKFTNQGERQKIKTMRLHWEKSKRRRTMQQQQKKKKKKNRDRESFKHPKLFFTQKMQANTTRTHPTKPIMLRNKKLLSLLGNSSSTTELLWKSSTTTTTTTRDSSTSFLTKKATLNH